MDESEQITAFWQWWERYETTLAAMMDKGAGAAAARTFGPQLEQHIGNIDPRLRYRIDEGATRRTLIISAQGDPLAMAVAQRVRNAAPPVNPRWSFSSVVPRSQNLSTQFFDVQGVRLQLAAARVEVLDLARKASVRLWHPGFLHFQEGAQISLTGAMLDEALGEEGTDCWIESFEPAPEEPTEGMTLLELRNFVDEVRSRFIGLPGESPWSTVEGTKHDGASVHARVRIPLCAARAPLLEKVVTIRLRLEDPAGSPHADALEERVTLAIGFDGELVAVETIDDLRTWYCYVQPGTGAVERLMALAKEEELAAEAATDPSWEVVSHLS